MAAQPRKGKTPRNCSLTLHDKLEIIKAVESGKHKRSFISRQFGISKSSISDVIKKKQKILEAFEVSKVSPKRKRLRNSTYADVEAALLLWLKQAKDHNLHITGPAIQDKGRELATSMGHTGLVCSKGWLHRFKIRNGIMFGRAQGANERSAPPNNRLNTPVSPNQDPPVEDVMQNGVQYAASEDVSGDLPDLLTDYCPQDIFSAGETGFYWKALPDFTVKETGVGYGSCTGGDDCCTIFICTNMTGEEKLPLLVIGRNSEPKVFTNVRTLPVLYEANDRAAVSDEIFSSWLVLIDKKFQQEGRKVAMIVNEDVPHTPSIQLQLEAVKLVFLPRHATARHQPCQQGIIRSVKASYRKYLMTKLIAAIEAGERFHLDLLDALHLLHLSWVNVSQDTIKSSFLTSGFKSRDILSASPEVAGGGGGGGALKTTPPPSCPEGDMLFQQLRTLGANLSNFLSFEQYVDVDSKISTAASSDAPASVATSSSSSLSSSQAKLPMFNIMANSESPSAVPLPPPSTNEAEKSVKVLRRYFETRCNMEQALNLVAEVEKRVLDCSVQPR